MAAGGRSWTNLPSVILLEIFTYLPRNDRISAASTCKHWRNNLHHASLWRSVTFTINSHDEKTIARNRYLASCFAKKLRNATVRFDSLDPICVAEAARIVKKLAKNPDLRQFRLCPSNCRFEFPEGCESEKRILESQGRQMLRRIVSQSRNLEVFTLGCMEDVTIYSQELLDTLVNYQSSSLRVLGLASLKDDPDDYLLPELNTALFNNFQHLQILSMDYDNVDDRLLLAMKSRLMQRFIVHVHGIADAHPNTSDSAWQTFKQNNPKCELRLTMIHSYDAVQDLHNTVLRPSMPLTHFRAFFCEELNLDALHEMSMWYSGTLRSIEWVDSLESASSDVFMDLGDVPNPLIMCAWRCKLEELVLYGYKLWEGDLHAIARLRGQNLRRFDLWRDHIVLDMSDRMEEVEQGISSELGYRWKPQESFHLDEVIVNPHNGDSDEYIMPLVQKDLGL